MPSKLGFYATPAAKFYATQRSDRLAPAVSPVFGPWGGYVPDVDPREVDYKSAVELYGLVPAGEVLTYDYGWRRYDGSVKMPFGANGSNVPKLGVDVVQVMPVVGLPRWLRQDSTAENVAIIGAIGSSTGYIAAFPDGGSAWTIKTITSGSRPGDTSEALYDWTNYSGGVPTGGATVTGLMFFTNNLDAMYVYPGDNTLTKYASVTCASGDVLAKSVAVWGERLFIFNTKFGTDVRQPLQLRWTELGWSTPSTAMWTNIGAGALILKELAGKGLRVLPLGNILACYATDGVAVLERTGILTAPFQLEYVSKTRGLLATRGVVDIGGGVHFGLFTDGWFFLDRNGQWTEVGHFTKGTVHVRKWANTFYESLDYDLKDRIDIQYDQLRGLVYIAWPDKNARALHPGGGNGRNNRLWVYDLRGDRVWPDRYDLGHSTNQTPICFGTFQEVGTPGITWDSAAAATPWTYTGASSWSATGWLAPWLQFTTATKTMRLVHGTSNGLVQQHSPELYKRDGVTPSWYYRVHSDPLGDQTTHKVLDRVWLEHVQTQPGVPVYITGASANGANTQARFALADGSHPTAVSNIVMSFRFPATHPVLQVGGQHPFILRAMNVQFLVPGTLNIPPKV